MSDNQTPRKAAFAQFLWRRLGTSCIALVQKIVLTVFLMQLVTATLLLIFAALRRRHNEVVQFPRRSFEDVSVGANRLRLYCYGCELYDDMLAAIDSAQESIYLESYIWKDDIAGREFKRHLTRKAKEGVAVYVIFDSFGNLVVSRAFKLFDRSVHVLEYQAVKSLSHIFDPRRYALDHRKLLIVDGQISFIGGYNIGSHYATSWRDTHLRIIGPFSSDIAYSFTDFWNRARKRDESRIHHSYPRKFDPFITLHGNDAIRLTFPIRDMYIEAINRAEKYIYLSNAYFIPDHILLGALKDAARRGVDVRVLVPLTSNHIIADWVSHSYYAEYLEAGIRLLRYKPAMLHCKTCTIDGQWSTIGTANLDRLSSLGNFEINVEIYSAAFAQQMELLFACDATEVAELTAEDWSHRSWLIKLSETLLTPFRFFL
jgi:cardiolipin synthase